MEKRIEQIIKTKEYLKLSTEELLLLQDWVEDEVQFYEMKEFLNQTAQAFSDVRPSKQLKKNLMVEYRSAYPNKGENRKILYLVFPAAAILVLALMAYWPKEEEVKEYSLPLAENKVISQEKEMKLVQADEANPADHKKERELSHGIVEKPEKMAELKQLPPESTAPEIESFGDKMISVPTPPLALRKKDSELAPAARLDIVTEEDNFGRLRNHSDFLMQGLLPESKKEYVQNNPSILDYLHTAY